MKTDSSTVLKEKMTYEIKKDGVLKMSTDSLKCLYDKKTRDTMRKVGYKIYKDGKVFRD